MTDEKLIFPHKLTLHERQELTISGVSEVVSFDDTGIVVHTQQGTLNIHGQDLQLQTLSLEGGQVSVKGSVSALIYEAPRPGGSWLHRLLG